MSTIRVRGPCGSRAREGAGELKGKMKLKSLHRRIPVGEALPLPKGGGWKRVTCYFLCPGHRNLVKIFIALLALSASPPAPVLPVVAWWGFPPLGVAHRCFLLAQREPKCGGSGMAPTAVELIYCVYGLHVC